MTGSDAPDIAQNAISSANDYSRLGAVTPDLEHDYKASMDYASNPANWFQRARGEWIEPMDDRTFPELWCNVYWDSRYYGYLYDYDAPGTVGADLLGRPSKAECRFRVRLIPDGDGYRAEVVR